MRNRIPVLNVLIDSVTMPEAINIAKQFIIKQKGSHMIATANAEMVMMALQDEEFAEILFKADLVVPDGAGVIWAARHQGYIMPERVAGYDLAQELFALAATEHYRIFLFGGAPGVVEQAKAKAEKLYPGVNIVGTRNGFFSASDEAEILQTIKSCSPDILLVALGVPKQEKWLTKNLTALNVPLCMGVGGTFDVMAGIMRRAPLWMQKMHLEWLFRLILQPQRALRMLALPRFVLKVLFTKKD